MHMSGLSVRPATAKPENHWAVCGITFPPSSHFYIPGVTVGRDHRPVGAELPYKRPGAQPHRASYDGDQPRAGHAPGQEHYNGVPTSYND